MNDTPLRYIRRGQRTFIVLLWFRLIPAVLFLFGVIILASFKSQILASLGSLTGPAANTLLLLFEFAVSGGLVIFVVLTAVMILISWLEYISLEFVFDDAAFKTRQGILNINETSVLYRQIQNINIDRPLMYRLFGMSRLVILTAGHEDNDTPEHDDSETYIDLIDKQTAEDMQHELLDRSSLQAARILHPVSPTDVHKY